MTDRLFGKKLALAGVFKASALSFIAILAIGIYDFILPIFTEGTGENLAVVGIIISLVYVASLLAEVPIGFAVDRFGRVKVLLISVVGLGILGIFYFLVQSIIYLAILSLVAGVVFIGFWVPSAVLVRDFSPRKMLSQSQGVYLTMSQLGWVVGPMIAGTVSIMFSDRHNFLIFSFFMFVSAIAAFTLFRGEKARRFRALEKSHKHKARLTLIFDAFKDYTKLHKHSFPIYILSFSAYIWIAAEWTFVALASIEKFAFTDQMAGFLLAAMMAIEGLLYYSSGLLMDKVGCKYILTSGFLILFSSTYFMFLAPSLEIFILASLIAAGATSWILPGTEALLTKIVPVNIMGEMTSVFDTSKDLGLIIGPLTGGALATIFANSQLPFLLVTAFAGVGCILSGYIFWPEKKKK